MLKTRPDIHNGPNPTAYKLRPTRLQLKPEPGESLQIVSLRAKALETALLGFENRRLSQIPRRR